MPFEMAGTSYFRSRAVCKTLLALVTARPSTSRAYIFYREMFPDYGLLLPPLIRLCFWSRFRSNHQLIILFRGCHLVSESDGGNEGKMRSLSLKEAQEQSSDGFQARSRVLQRDLDMGLKARPETLIGPKIGGKQTSFLSRDKG